MVARIPVYAVLVEDVGLRGSHLVAAKLLLDVLSAHSLPPAPRPLNIKPEAVTPGQAGISEVKDVPSGYTQTISGALPAILGCVAFGFLLGKSFRA
jgi:hypothetical protein